MSMIKFFLFFAVLMAAYSPVASANDLSVINSHSDDPIAQTAWLKLLHYREAVLSNYSSEIDGADFYLTKKGIQNPAEEFEAHLLAFRKSQQNSATWTSTNANERPGEKLLECRFPARFTYFRKYIKEAKDWKSPTCARFENFRDRINARSATLVFSAYYLNNPASAFGHTFLRLNKDEVNGERYPLLDYGLGYAADAGDVDPLSFALGGLFGWFKGSFTSIPYYLKVQEYNDYESRDLWEYELKLTEAEIKMLVEHLWELAHSTIHYKYLSKNCSSLMFTSLEAAAPHLELMDKLPYWVIPTDTIHALYEIPGLVTGYKFRPSKRSQFLARYDQLSEENKKKFSQITKSEEPLKEVETLKDSERGEMLDTLIDYYDFRFYKKLVHQDPEIVALKEKTLQMRSQLPAMTQALVVPEPKFEKPHTGHKSARSNAGMLWTKSGERSYLLGQKFALHDLLDKQEGYPRDSAIDFLEFNLRVLSQAAEGDSAKSAVRFENAYAFAVKSHAPYEALLPNISWKVRIGGERTWDNSCHDCFAGVFGGSGGLTWEAISNRLFATALISSDVSASGEFLQSPFKIRLGPELNLRALLSRNLIAQINVMYLRLFLSRPDDAYKATGEFRWSAESAPWALGASVTHLPQDDVETKAQLFYYW